MDEQQLPDIRVSPSQLGQAQLCHARNDPIYKSLPGYDDTPTEQASFGRVLHAMIETRLVCGEPASVAFSDPDHRQVVARWVIAQDGADWFDFHQSSARRQQWVDEIYEAYLQWEEWWELGWEQWCNDQPFDLWVERHMTMPRTAWSQTEWSEGPFSLPYTIRGTPDLIVPHDEEPIGFDWKTAAKGWKEGQQKTDKMDQLSAYTALYYGDRPVVPAMSWVVGVYNRKAEMWEWYETTRSEGQVSSTLGAMDQVALAKSAGAYIPRQTQTVYGKTERGWWCSAKWCAAWNVCFYKNIGDGKENDERKVEWR